MVIGSRTRLYGQVKHAVSRGARRSGRSKVRWKLVGGPRRSGIRATRAGARRPLARLTSPVGLTAGLRPRVPGSYTLQLTHGAGKSATRDRVTIDAVPRSPLVPVDTMVSTQDGQQGIRVGGTTYRLRDAVKRGNGFDTYVQALALERKTLAPVLDSDQRAWNRMYTSVSALGDDLRGLDDTNLVILVLQPSTGGGVNIGELNDVVGRIGVPNYGNPFPKGPGEVSAIGVPGMARGDADVNVIPEQSERGAPMRGYLSPDQYLNYGFVAPESYAFSYGAKEVPTCGAGDPPDRCGDNVGYRLNVKDARTFEPRPGDNWVYNTGGRGLTAAQQSAEANRMADDLNAMKPDDVVIIQTVGIRRAGEASYPLHIGAVDRATMQKLALAVARVGGTRDAFNRAALVAGVPASGGAVYSLVGWAGGREGEGEEVAAGVDGAGDAPMLSFVLRPDRQSHFRPVQATSSNKNTDALSALLLKPPTTGWPLDDDPGAKKAISFLGSQDKRLGPDPRAAYWTQSFDQATTTAIWDRLASVPYPNDQGFTKAQFEAAREQLKLELGYVGNVRTYLTDLTKPYAENALASWAAAETIANDVYNDVEKPDDEVALRWIEFTEVVLDLFGPLTHDVTGAVGAALQLGVLAYGRPGQGRPAARRSGPRRTSSVASSSSRRSRPRRPSTALATAS